MRCAWNELLHILPQQLRSDVDKYGKETLQELRLRLRAPIQLVTGSGDIWLEKNASESDISFIINAASQYSPWAAATASQGYITAPGGHRIGMCGDAVIKDNKIMGIRTPGYLCIRVARDFPGIANGAPVIGNLLVLGPPGSGKTTLLRDLIRQRSNLGTGSVAVMDERCELFPIGMATGCRTDILTGCSKVQGIPMLLRTMGPSVIAVDEITDKADCIALEEAAWCGVSLLATAHAGSISDLKSRCVYRPLLESGIFENVIVVQRDKSWRLERMVLR